MTEISSTDDLIDSRNVVTRFEELSYASDNDFIDDDEKLELKSLARLIMKGIDLEDWDHGAILVHSGYFTEYIKDYMQEAEAEALNVMANIFKANLDWEGIADDMRHDFTIIEWEGETFYTR